MSKFFNRSPMVIVAIIFIGTGILLVTKAGIWILSIFTGIAACYYAPKMAFEKEWGETRDWPKAFSGYYVYLFSLGSLLFLTSSAFAFSLPVSWFSHFICPVGFENLDTSMDITRHTEPGQTIVMPKPVYDCKGTLGTVNIDFRAHVIIFLFHFLVAYTFFHVALLLRRAQKHFQFHRLIVAPTAVMAIVGMLTLLTIEPVRSFVSKPVVDLFYWGHPYSLASAIRYSRHDLVTELLDRGADPTYRVNPGYRLSDNDTAIELVKKNGNHEMWTQFATLLAGDDPAKQALIKIDYAFTEDDFVSAIRSGDAPAINLFLDSGFEVDDEFPDRAGTEFRRVYTKSPMHIAAAVGQIESLKALIKRKSQT